MNPIHIAKIAQELNLTEHQVQATAELLEADATVPFIARYRKEATGSLDEVVITAIRDRLNALSELDSRRESVLKSLEQNGHLTDELKDRVMTAETSAELEDIYLPYRPKRRTRAIIAREKGLEPLAMTIWGQTGIDPAAEAIPYVNPEIGVDTVEDALAGARDILAEMVNEHAVARSRIRTLFMEKGVIHSAVVAGKEADGAKYRDYFDWKESIATAPSHRVLAMRRGEREDFLNVSIAPPEEEALLILQQQFVTGDGDDSRQVMAAVQDAWKRLLSRSMETEIRLWARENADIEA
ncbi:MAG: Tex-like N-terminal domain-containing protein, partial [Desulfatirhabdiaceae bacterium]